MATVVQQLRDGDITSNGAFSYEKSRFIFQPQKIPEPGLTGSLGRRMALQRLVKREGSGGGST